MPNHPTSTPSTTFINQKPPPPLPPLPPHKTLHKRPLLHPPIPPPSHPSTSSTPKTIYISARTPFVSAIKRARALLGNSPGEVVLLKASGRAIEKALQVGLLFLESGEGVRVFTGGSEVLDDIVDDEGGKGRKRKWGEEDGEGEKGEGEGDGEEEGDWEVRKRRTSTVEVWVTKK
ncbi:hypothetical protein L873DRAFT_1786558 [Choiromyces venosus 120613-1]|uniref:Uncharacterized protein n=1 Tax=Choiromyces venosus 120613-1 TaxID=1336337 RepID=A0A3N4K000_9PEZI|nr:hypothetical protein L873DRAFT_1786558 [Choiromyces venosus 120613-1]